MSTTAPLPPVPSPPPPPARTAPTPVPEIGAKPLGAVGAWLTRLGLAGGTGANEPCTPVLEPGLTTGTDGCELITLAPDGRDSDS